MVSWRNGWSVGVAAWADEKKASKQKNYSITCQVHKEVFYVSPQDQLEAVSVEALLTKYVNHPECVLYRNLRKFDSYASYNKATNKVLKILI